MSKIILIAGMSKKVPCMPDATYIGVDHGAVCCMQQNIPMLMAVGDFDSVSKSEYEQLQQITEVKKLSVHKNETDSEVAISYALALGYEEIILYGSLGGRIDHEMANVHLMLYRDLPIILMDEQNIVQVIKAGTYKVKKEHTYLSFLALEDSCISERGVMYPLEECKLTPKDIYSVSNEFCDTYADITLHYGKMLMMQTEDKRQ